MTAALPPKYFYSDRVSRRPTRPSAQNRGLFERREIHLPRCNVPALENQLCQYNQSFLRSEPPRLQSFVPKRRCTEFSSACPREHARLTRRCGSDLRPHRTFLMLRAKRVLRDKTVLTVLRRNPSRTQRATTRTVHYFSPGVVYGSCSWSRLP